MALAAEPRGADLNLARGSVSKAHDPSALGAERLAAIPHYATSSLHLPWCQEEFAYPLLAPPVAAAAKDAIGSCAAADSWSSGSGFAGFFGTGKSSTRRIHQLLESCPAGRATASSEARALSERLLGFPQKPAQCNVDVPLPACKAIGLRDWSWDDEKHELEHLPKPCAQQGSTQLQAPARGRQASKQADVGDRSSGTFSVPDELFGGARLDLRDTISGPAQVWHSTRTSQGFETDSNLWPGAVGVLAGLDESLQAVLDRKEQKSFQEMPGSEERAEFEDAIQAAKKREEETRKRAQTELARTLQLLRDLESSVQIPATSKISAQIPEAAPKQEGTRRRCTPKFAKASSAPAAAIQASFKFENLDFDKVMSDSKLAESLKSQTREAIAHSIQVPSTSVDVKLAKGSVVVNAQIRCPTMESAELVNKSIDARLMQTVDNSVAKIPAITEAIADGKEGLGVGGLSTSVAPLVSEASTPVPAVSLSGSGFGAMSQEESQSAAGAGSGVPTLGNSDTFRDVHPKAAPQGAWMQAAARQESAVREQKRSSPGAAAFPAPAAPTAPQAPALAPQAPTAPQAPVASAATASSSMNPLEHRARMIQMVEQAQTRLEPFKSSDVDKRFRLETKKLVNTKITQISANVRSVRESFSALRDYIDRTTPQAGVNSGQDVQLFVETTVAYRLTDEAEVGIKAKARAAWPVAFVAAAIFARFPNIQEFFEGFMHTNCPYLAPDYTGSHPNRQSVCPGQRDQEPYGQFVERMVGYMRLWLAVAVVQDDLAIVWQWLARTLNAGETAPIAATLMQCVLEMAASAALDRYNQQFVKLLAYIESEYLQELESLRRRVSGEQADQLRASHARLRFWLEQFNKTKQAPPPEGRQIEVIAEVELNENA